MVGGLSDQLSATRRNDGRTRCGSRSFQPEPLGAQIHTVARNGFPKTKRPVGASWRSDETYISVKGQWKFLYQAVDKAGRTVDFLLTAKCDRKAALRVLRTSIDQRGTPEKLTIDKSGANTAAIESVQADSGLTIELRQSKYLNNIVEQDHRANTRIVRPMLGFKSFGCTPVLIAGIETKHMIRKEQLDCPEGQKPHPQQTRSISWRSNLQLTSQLR